MLRMTTRNKVHGGFMELGQKKMLILRDFRSDYLFSDVFVLTAFFQLAEQAKVEFFVGCFGDDGRLIQLFNLW